MGLFSKRSAPPTDRDELVAWMRERSETGHFGDIWQHRLHLGYEFGQGDTAERTWFWLNAYPALAGLE